MKTRLKRVFLFMLSALMLFTSLPLSVFAKVDYDNLTDNKSEIVNKLTPVKPAKPAENQTAKDLIENPKQPAIYTLRTDYKVQRGEKYQVDYQPYIASVGEAASQAEKDKVNKTMDLPDIAGYDKPQENFTIDYNTVKGASDGKNKEGNDINGFRFSDNKEFNYSAKSNKIKIKHVFQDLEDFTKYTNPDGTITQSDGSKGTLIKKGETRSEEVTIEEVEKHELIITQNGNTGSTMQASPLSESDPRRKGFIPEADYINMQVPQNAENFVLEYRYNRAHYDVVFDTAGGTPLPTRTLYYGQAMPKIADEDIPTKVGGEFQGWKPSVDLTTKDGKTYKANEIIAVGTGSAIKNLDANLIMPASNVTFTAVWKDKEKADYAIQFWAEKADHADGAPVADKYDYIGTRVYKDKDTGMRPNLDNEPVKDIVFPDLAQARLKKIWANARFNRGRNLYLNKFYVYNDVLTHDENKDPKNPSMVKKVEATGKTVYNIYYDRQVYDLYFTKSNAQPEKNTIYPEIWGYDPAKGEAVMLGGPGKPYHYKARFNEMMYKWPNDAKQTKGFTPGYQSFGWGPNYTSPNWPVHLDTPPYRLNADEFLDMENYTSWGGYTKHIDKGDGTTIDLDPTDFRTLSFGIKQDNPSIPHHMDFWMDGFKDGETIIRYDLVRTKADTAGLDYGHKYPIVTGFTPRDYDPKNPQSAWPVIKEGQQENGRVNEEGINDLNDERDDITPNNCGSYYNNNGIKLPIGQLNFIPVFFSDADEWGDAIEGGQAFKENGYLRFKYKRNKYPLRFNYDPSIIRDDSYFKSTNQLDTFYEFPLKALSPDVDSNDEYKKVGTKEGPKNLLDNPANLQKLGLKDLVYTDSKDGKLKVKRPEGLSDQMVFKGWALDPAGTKLIWENPGEKMPFHPVNLYAKWGEPDYQWKVTFDPNGGNLSSIDEAKVTKKRKIIQVGDKGQEETKTFAHKEANEGDKQIFTVIQRQKLVEPKKPTKKGYDFMGWEAIRYTKDAKGDYTNQIDDSYRKTYKVPELYSFGNDVVSPIYLKAIWVPNDRVDVKVEHHILSLDLSKETEMRPETLYGKRAGNLVATSGDKQNEKYILATHKDLEEKLTGDLKKLYEDYNARVKANNTFFQTFKVEPEKIDDGSGNLIDNPKFKDNVFHFFYRPFRTRDYKVNYIDERGKAEVEKFFKGLDLTDTSGLKDEALLKANEENKKKFEDKRTDFEELIKKHQIIAPEAVSNGNRHYDARNYRRIPGWVLADNEKSQQQLFFDVNEKTNEFLGINGTGSDQIFFYYKDVRVIETKKDDPTPDGYVRVTFKAEKGGSFKDKDGKEVTELYYDVIKGLQSQLLPVPQEWVGGKNDDGSEKQKEEGKYYITPETGKKFIKWDNKPLLNDNTIIKEAHTFTAYFEWSGLSASGLVRTEAFKDKNNTWTNDFAPKIADLKKQLVWMEKGGEKPLPTGAVIKLYDEAGTELTKDDQVYDLVNEKNKADNDELVRTVNIKAKVTFTDGKDPQELDIPIKVYKNVYEALTTGKKPLFLSEAEKKEAKDGGLKDITGEYVKVTVAPTGDMSSKDNKVYYVNKNAWVEIPEVKPNGSSTLINWTADKVGQNDNGEANGKFDFAKRHKFTEDTLISPRFSQTSELVVHESYKDSKNNWVNDFIKRELTDDKIKAAIQVKNGNATALGDGDTVTIVDDAGKPYADDAALKAALYKKLQEKDDDGKASRIEDIKVKVTFANGEVQTLTVPVKVIKNIYQAKTKTGKPDYVPANYVKVTLDPTTKAIDPQKYFYYVNPNAKVLIPGTDPEGVKEDFTGWTMKADSAAADVVGTTYKLNERHQFAEASTITAQYGQGKVNIKYVDENNEEIDIKYHIDGVDYPTEKIGKIGDNVSGPNTADAPKFKGYIISSVSLDNKSATYTDPATATITYKYSKKVTTEDKSQNDTQYFPVIFDANSGEFGTDPKNQKIVYVAFDGNSSTLEKVTFEEVRQAIEEKYGKPSKADETFVEWQDKATDGNKVADDYEIKFKGLDQQTRKPLGETFYANYDKASALVKYLDLNGKPIADEFKISTEKYPTEKAGTADEAIPSDVFTKDSAPKFTGYKFNRIELNPKDGKYALINKATIKIYYEKDSDVIPAENGTEKPDGYVEVKFVPTDKAKDDKEKIFYVNPKKDVTIPIANPEAKATFTFKEWKIGAKADGAVYTPSTPKKFTEKETVITATYEETKNIIPYDPSATDPMSRPEGYVRVSFAADKGLSLTEQKAYYVKKNADITLGNAELAKPGYKAETGYEFEKWDQEDTTVIKDTDILVTAKATVLKDVDTENHPGYVKVTFKAGPNGVIKDSSGNTIPEQVYYVNPNKYVNLPAPTPDGNTGYDFAAWKSGKSQSDFSLANFINYKENTTITAMFNQKEAVYPKLDGSTKPEGYVEVTFVINGTDGKIADNEIKTYYVDPTRQVSLKAPKTMAGTGFIFDKWRLGTNPNDQIIKPAEERQYSKDTTIYGSFTKLKDIIPSTNDDGTPNLQPIDYVAVLFIGGDHANKLDGQILYYVNPKANPAQTIGNLTKPTVTPDTGWKHTGWDVQDSTVIKDYIFVVAQYEALDDVIPKTKVDDSEKPAGYVKVTFKAGANGKLQGGEKTYFVNPNKYVKLTPPTTVPNTSFEFSTWESDGKDFILANNINYTKDTIITAKFNTKGDVIPKTKSDDSQKPPTFVKVTFVIDPTDAGKIEDGQTITYFVRPNTEVTIHPPKTTANTGYEFEKWSIDTTEAKQYTTDTTVKGEFKKLNDIIPSKNPDGTVNAKPEGYVIVNFLKGDHGVLDGRTTFYVNPKAGKKLKDLDISGITVVPMPTYKFSNWDKPMETAIAGTSDINVTAEYTQLPNIIKAGPKDTAPSGYVVIIFETDGKGTIKGNDLYENEGNKADSEREIVYFVNPKKDVKLAPADATASQTQLPVPKTSANNPDKYIFDQWLTEIDTKSPIIRGRVHIATFKPKVVKLTYDANEATGTVPAELTVDYDTNVRLAGKGDLAKKDASFKGWKIGTEIHQAGDQINLKENTTAYAQWDDDKKIIEYNPVDNPTTRPDNTYVRVTFAVEDGLKLKEQKAYYVKKDAGIKLGDTNLAKPGYTVETGYKFDKWDKEDSLVITEDILVTAKSTKLGTVIPEKDKNGNTNAKPEGYKEVVFVVKAEDATKGSLEGNTKFYVNPTEYVTINPPTTKANTGFEFGAWDKDTTRPTVYKEDATITGSFNGLKDVIPKTNPDGSEKTKPDGYKTVSFVIDPATGGKIVDGEVTVYYVNPAKDVTLPQPKTLAETGYKFEKWDQDTSTAKMYTDNTTVKGNFKKLEDIIPSTDDKGKPNAKPDGYITVTFDKGEHGTLSGQEVYYVNPKANKTIADLKKPTVSTETGWKQKDGTEAWDKNDSTPISGAIDIVVKAQYEALLDVIVKTADNDSEKPEGYITVTFDTTNKGRIQNTSMITKKVLYVNPNKAIVLNDKAPGVVPKTGYEFAKWDVSIDKAIQYKEGTIITALYNAKGDVIPQKEPNGSDQPAGYLKVMFAKGEHGELSGKTVYYVNPNKEVTVPAPTVTASIGWKQKTGDDAWDQKLTQKFTAETTTITAQYEPLADVVPQEKTDGSDKPFGYITVTFKADANGSLAGKTVYYVNPEKIVDLTSTADSITKNPNTGYTAEGGTWNKTLKDKFNNGDVITFNFKALADVIEEKPGVTKPDGYVTVKFIPTDKATDTKEKVYFVNPLKKVTITEEPTGTKVKDANDVSYDYTFTGWTVTRGAINSWKGSTVSDKFIQDTDITAKYSVTLGNIMPLPLAKDNAVTAINDTPEAKDLIKNPSDLPQGTTFAYADNGQPKVDQAGNVNAKVKVTYPNGKTSIVTVPITVVDHVVPQIGGEDGQKPLVPEAYVKVTVDTTDKATPNTMFTKVFWVKPNVEVTIPGILAPTGKVVEEDGVKKTNNFIKWISSDDKKEYKDTIKDTFTKDTKITADYEFNKNTDPVGKDNLWFSLNSKPGPKDFIKNAYDDNNPDAVGALPPGTKFAFKDGIEPKTNVAGGNTATISVTYPNGEVKDIKVNYNVTGDVVEIEKGVEKPPVPDNFVTVIVKTTDKATEDVTRTFRVNPEKVVPISVASPKGKKVDKTPTSPEIQYVFKGWQSDEDPVRTWAESISGQFTAKVTTITAQYDENIGQPGIVDAGMYYTSESLSGVNNYLPSEDELKALVKSQVQGDIEEVSILTNDFDSEVYDKLKENGKLDREEISRTETIKAKITFVNGSTKEIDIPIVVYKNIYEGLTNGAKPQYVVQAEDDLKKSNPGRDDNDYVRVTLIPTAKAKNQQRKTYYVRKNASVIIPEIIAEGRDAYQFMYWEAETPGKGQDNPNYGWATRSIAMFRSAEPINKDDLVNNGKIIDKVDGNTRMSFDRDTDIVAQYKAPTPTPTPDEPDKPNPDYPNYPEYRPNYSGGSTIYIEKPVEKVIKVPDNAFVKEVRYMQGFEGKFRPFDGLTRAEAAQILANALKEDGYKYDPNYKISYKDIGNAWYTEAVKIVTQANVFNGYDDGNFKPQEKITRAEWIGTLKRFQELRDLSGNHMNLREGHWAMAEIEAAYQAGWLAIYSDGLADFKADEFIPRQEVAAVSNKAFERVLDKTYIKRNDKTLVNYKDINDKMWSYEDILCASNTFLHDKKLYRAHGIDMSNEIFNINLDGFTITKDKFQRIER
ncbi:S-layer homology domain-containing protein [Peptoniphilus lacrimalis]|uniref:S-layer homology domain-containing protein n=1 Tax=Peptoniphilus lacrimalis TaxID=33031 RepID=UPI003D72B804